MKIVLCFLVIIAVPALSDAQNPATNPSVDEAVLPLPESLRADATVLAPGEDGRLAVVRQGTGAMICLADDPSREGFHVACYHKDLDPFMARGRELRRLGKERAEVVETRGKEIAEGSLMMPPHPSALYSISGPDGCFDTTTKTLCDAQRLYVVYIPYATSETTGLSTDATRGVPWLMEAGKPWAHIMMTPPE